MDDNWRRLFQYVGVTEEQMHNQGTMEFIYDFVEKSGGIENFNREIIQIERSEPPPPPSRDTGGAVTLFLVQFGHHLQSFFSVI